MVAKENRHEDGTRNQNGRLYKERAQEKDVAAASCSRGVQGAEKAARARRLIQTLLLAIFVLCATTITAVKAIESSVVSSSARQTGQVEPVEEPLNAEQQQLLPRASV